MSASISARARTEISKPFSSGGILPSRVSARYSSVAVPATPAPSLEPSELAVRRAFAAAPSARASGSPMMSEVDIDRSPASAPLPEALRIAGPLKPCGTGKENLPPIGASEAASRRPEGPRSSTFASPAMQKAGSVSTAPPTVPPWGKASSSGYAATASIAAESADLASSSTAAILKLKPQAPRAWLTLTRMRFLPFTSDIPTASSSGLSARSTWRARTSSPLIQTFTPSSDPIFRTERRGLAVEISR